MQDPENPEWTPPPPPTHDSPFSDGTRDFEAAEIRNGSNKALIFGILSIFCCPPIFAYLAFTTAEEVISKIDTYEVEHGRKSMAQAAKVLAIVGISIWVVSLILRWSSLV